MSSLIQAELTATCSSLGGMHDGKYVVEPQCAESVRDIIRFLRRDNEYHEVRRFLGEAKILQTDLVPIAATNTGDLFEIVIRLLINLTNPVMLLYKEEIPIEKVGRNIYMSLLGYTQEYKVAFCNVPLWSAICRKLSELFEIDWAERSEDQSLLIERMLVLLRNVLQAPADGDSERLPDNDITVHDKILWALRESQLLELLLFIASNKDESKYYLHLLEIFSLILREQNPEFLASCDVRFSSAEREKDINELVRLRDLEKSNSRVFKNTRNFTPTYVVKNVKSISDNEVIYHKSLDKLCDLKLTQDKKRVKTPKNKCPTDSERPERRSTFSVRLFLKEFCVELLSCSFNNLMAAAKEKIVGGKALPNDESYYFWAVKFFLQFACFANVDIKLISECINVQTFHFTQTQIENCYDNLVTDKKKMTIWIKRLHCILKAYRSLLHTLIWMDKSQDKKVRETSKVLKTNVFYVPEYRELLLNCFLKYDPGKFPNSFLRDLVETNHLNLKLLEHFCKTDKIVVQKKKRVIKRTKKAHLPKEQAIPDLTPDEIWEQIKETAYDLLMSKSQFPEIPPFDAASEIPIDEQKEEAMKNVHKYLRNKDVRGAIGLLRSSRQVWPENDIFGSINLSEEDELMVLQEICLANLHVEKSTQVADQTYEGSGDDEEEEEEEERVEIIEQNFEMQDYIKKLVNKKIVEGCSILLAQYKHNSAHINHCIVKLLHRIAWDCKSPAMLFQASLFLTFLKIMNEKDVRYKEIQQFAKFIVKKFREFTQVNPKIYMELLFWKEAKTAYDIEYGYGANDNIQNRGTWAEEEEDELRRLWIEFDEKMLNTDKIDWIRGNLINQSRSRLAIIKKLKDLMLIMPGTKVLKKKNTKCDWSVAEETQLRELFSTVRDAIDPVDMIKNRLTFGRSKRSIKEKLVEMGLVSNLSELRKKRMRKGRKVDEISQNQSDNESDMNNDSQGDNTDDEDFANANFPSVEVIAAMQNVVDMTEALGWLKGTFEESLEEDGSDGYPLLALDTASSEALENEQFQKALKLLNVKEPCEEHVFWNIPSMSRLELNKRLEIVEATLSGTLNSVVTHNPTSANDRVVSDGSDSEDEFEKLRKSLKNSVSQSTSPSSQNVNKSPIMNLKSFNERRKTIESDNSESEIDSVEQGIIQSHPIDSDRSDQGENSENEEVMVKHKSRIRRPTYLASDSEDEALPHREPYNQKRRRCIGSDSEVEGNPSDEEEISRPLEVRKRSKMIDSDSDLEGHGSTDEADVRMSR